MSSHQDYITYVIEQIEYFKEQTNLIDQTQNEVTPPKLNKALANFSNTQLTLHAEYRRKDKELRKLRRQYQAWWDEKYVEKRRELNPTTLPGSKWLSKGEIESETRVSNKKEYEEWRDKLDDLEDQVDFLKSLRDEWSKHGAVLNTLSQNARQEMISLSIGEGTSNTQPYRAHAFNGRRRRKSQEDAEE